MLQAMLPTKPISALRTEQPEIVDSLRKSPAVLTRDGRGICILVHPRQWNYLIEVYNKAKEAGLLEAELVEYVDEKSYA
jgi:hypothetical protein